MKPSHYTTPRTLAETTFVTGYTSTGPRPFDREDRIVLWASAAVALAVVVLAVVEALQ